MVNDPRVSHQLARLGGVYRDPARVDRDASTLLNSSVGNHLQPITATYVDSNGKTSTVLVLQGTIAMHFRGNTYQLLMDIYLISGYPVRPPVCYVRLADSTMYLKPNHKHVGSDGKVYLPYLHEWSSTTHNLVELVVAMSSVFSAEPPVFSRPNPPPAAAVSSNPQQQQPPPPPIAVIHGSVVQAQSVYGASANNNSNGPTGSGTSYSFDRDALLAQQSRTAAADAAKAEAEERRKLQEFKIAREIAEANAAAEVARLAELDEQRKRDEEELVRRKQQQEEEAKKIQKQWEIRRIQETKSEVEYKIMRYCQSKSAKIQKDVEQDLKDSQLLSYSTQHKVDDKIEQYKQQKELLTKQISIVNDKKQDIQLWLQEHSTSNNSEQEQNGSARNTNGIDDIDNTIVPSNVLHEQMISLSAEYMTYQDVLYFLDKAFFAGHMDCTTHLKHVRKIARKQFYTRALLQKIHNHMMINNHTF